MGAAAGLIPGVDAVSNFAGAAFMGINAAAVNGTAHSAASVSLGGALTNVVGTASGAIGLYTGSTAATTIGLGLLGVSGLSGAFMGATLAQ